MSALYWPLDEYDCTAESRRIAVDSLRHLHFDSERDACLTFLQLFGTRGMEDPLFLARFTVGDRYVCIRGPGGLVRGVRE